jgi:hypothetical protein
VTEDGAIAAVRSDGSVVVLVGGVFFEKLVTFQVRSHASCISFKSFNFFIAVIQFLSSARFGC